MRHLQRVCGLLSVVMLVVPAAIADWSDNFDSYAVGSGLIGQGGWEGWDASPAADAFVSARYALSTPHSAQIIGTSDLIHQFFDYTSGEWVFTAWLFVPDTFVGQSYFLLLNTYNHLGPYNWSCQVLIDAAGVLHSDPEGAELPLIREQWAEIRVVINLDTNIQTFYYDGAMLYEKSWTEGMSGGGALNIGCVDLYGNSADPVYYDDCSLRPSQPTPVESATWGQIKDLYH